MERKRKTYVLALDRDDPEKELEFEVLFFRVIKGDCPASCSAVWNAVRAECKKTADSAFSGI